MKLSHVVLVTLLGFPVAISAASGDAEEFWALMGRAYWLGAQNRGQEALPLLESGLKRFPEREFEITSQTAMLYALLGNREK